jgi:hypothetical protein
MTFGEQYHNCSCGVGESTGTLPPAVAGLTSTCCTSDSTWRAAACMARALLVALDVSSSPLSCCTSVNIVRLACSCAYASSGVCQSSEVPNLVPAFVFAVEVLLQLCLLVSFNSCFSTHSQGSVHWLPWRVLVTQTQPLLQAHYVLPWLLARGIDADGQIHRRLP